MKRALLALVAVFAGSVAGLGAAAAPAGAAPCATGALHVAMVVDFGDSVTITSTCVTVQSGDNAATALVDRAQLLGTKAPEFQNGLLCAIDGYPDLATTHCAAQNPDGTYAYWSYWHGSAGAWTYSSVGATFRVQADIVEGWRYFPHGQDTSSLPPPRGSAVASDTCPPPAPATTAPDPGPTSAEPAVASSSSSPADRPSTTAPASTSTTTTTLPGSGNASTSSPSRSTSSASGQADRPVVTVSAGHGSSGGSAVGVLAGVGLTGALAGGGAVMVRRRAGGRR